MADNQAERNRSPREHREMFSRVVGSFLVALTIFAMIPVVVNFKLAFRENYYAPNGVRVGENAVEYYKSLNRPEWTAYENSSLIFYIGKSPLRVTEGAEDGKGRPLSVIAMSKAFPSKPISVTLSLIEYHTGKVAYQSAAQISKDNCAVEIPESDIKPDTLYYYAIKSEGFKTVISDEPFYLKKTSKNALQMWPLLEEKKVSYGHPFYMRLLDAAGNPIGDDEFKNCAFHIQESSKRAKSLRWGTNFAMYGFSLNEDGMVCWGDGAAKFEMQSGFVLQVQNADGSYSDVALKSASLGSKEPDIATAVVSVNGGNGA